MDDGPLQQRANIRSRVRGAHRPTEVHGSGTSDDPSGAQPPGTVVFPGEMGQDGGLDDAEESRERASAAALDEYEQHDRERALKIEGPYLPGSDVLPAYRSAAVGSYKFEYLDHTADVQLHAWGVDLKEAFENCALAMFNYMSPINNVQQRETRRYRAEGHDLPSLLYGFLDELLFVFATELFLAASVAITSFDRTAFVIEAEGRGDIFDRTQHEAGTEIKAITYSAMCILERDDDAEVFVIVDI